MLGYALLSLRAQLHGAPHQIIKTVGVDRPHQLVADDAAMVDQKGFGRSINTEVNGGLAFKVNHLTAPGVAVALYPGEGVLAPVFPVETDQLDGGFTAQSLNKGVLFAAGPAPAAPDVEHERLTNQVDRKSTRLNSSHVAN